MKVASLFIYPIKSCAEFRVSELDLQPYGPKHDRQFVIVDEKGQAITQREAPKLATVLTALDSDRLYVVLPGRSKGLQIPLIRENGQEREAVVWGDTCRGFDEGPEVAYEFSSFLGRPARLVRYLPQNPRLRMSSHLNTRVSISFADAYPLLVISKASLDDLNSRLPRDERPLLMNRFRPNIVIEGPRPYEEDEWAAISVSGVGLQGVNQCVRCATTLVDQATGESGKEPLRTLNQYRKTPKGVVFGRNFIHLAEGVIHDGDSVMLA